MLKYTLGALAALAIIIVTAFVVVSQVTDGNAGTGPAPQVIAVIYNDHLSPPTIEVERGRITDLRFDNQSGVLQTVIVGGKGVEVLPQLPKTHDEPVINQIRSSVAIDVSPGQSGSILVRFSGDDDVSVATYVPGTFERLDSWGIAVK